MDSDELSAKIDELEEFLASEPKRMTHKEVWALVREIGAGFKGIRYPSGREREAEGSRYQLARQRLHDEREINAQRGHELAGTAEARIEALEQRLGQVSSGAVKWVDFWKESTSVREFLKSFPGLTKQKRDELWSKVNTISDRARGNSDVQRRELK